MIEKEYHGLNIHKIKDKSLPQRFPVAGVIDLNDSIFNKLVNNLGGHLMRLKLSTLVGKLLLKLVKLLSFSLRFSLGFSFSLLVS